MAKIELSIHKDYVPDWGVWQGVRECMQNALDENDKGHRMTVTHDNDILRIRNDESELEIQHLLLGLTTKANDEKSRGEKGEGLDLGLLALVRAGYQVEIRTPTETWKPYIGHSKQWRHEVLFIQTRKVQVRRNGTEIAIAGVTSEEWTHMKNRFLSLCDIDSVDMVKCGSWGDLLRGAEYKGNIYAQGIYVCHDSELSYGYDLRGVKLDRDRSMVRDFDLRYHICKIFEVAIDKHPDIFGAQAWDMIHNDAKDVEGFSSFCLDVSTSNALTELFAEKYGEDAIPVESTGESEEMASYGKRGIVTPLAIRKAISWKVESPDSVRSSLSNQIERIYSWEELDAIESHVLKSACNMVGIALDAFRDSVDMCTVMRAPLLLNNDVHDILKMISVANFRDDSILGMWSPDKNLIYVSRDNLKNVHLTLCTIIHELAHKMSGAGDAKVSHLHAVEQLWMAISAISGIK